jgi:hypothetical protein
MLTVAEENKVEQFVEAARRNLSICHIDVTDFALLRCRETCQVPARRVLWHEMHCSFNGACAL